MFRLITCAIFSALLLPVAALSQGLPEQIATPYVAYEQAMGSGDRDAALTHALAAWEAAEALDYPASTTSILADNYAQLALQAGEYEAAMRSFRRTAELLEEDGADTFTLAQTWMLAAHSALAHEDRREAIRCADTAGDLIRTAENIPPELLADVLFTSRAIEAVSHWGEGNMRRAFGRANDAIRAAGDMDFTSSAYYPILTFVKGASHAVLNDDEDAAYWLTLAYHYMPQERDALYWWSSYARGELDQDDREDLLERLAATDLPEIEDTDWPETEEERAAREATNALISQDGFVEAQVIDRRYPRYPERAANFGFEGVAVVRFTIDETGRVVDPELVMSVPVGDFGEAGMSVMDQWEYEPATLNGEPVARPNKIVQFDFAFAN